MDILVIKYTLLLNNQQLYLIASYSPMYSPCDSYNHFVVIVICYIDTGYLYMYQTILI